jgi:hypothetical protein
VRLPGIGAALLLVFAAATACDTGPAPAAAVAASPAPSLVPGSAAPVSPGQAAPTPLPTVPALAGARPNPNLTPGETFAGVTAQQVCVSGYAGRVRKVLPAQYGQVYAAYGVLYPEPAGSYELDHLVPLELGGDNSNRNLWPEPASPVPGFHQKDQLENYLHDAVCGGRLALATAQAGIASDWIGLYHQYLQP